MSVLKRVIGYKRLTIGFKPNELPGARLYSEQRGTQWESAELTAEFVPTRDGSDGIYAWPKSKGSELLEDHGPWLHQSPVYAVVAVELSGAVHEHADGTMRGQKAHLLALRVVGGEQRFVMVRGEYQTQRARINEVDLPKAAAYAWFNKAPTLAGTYLLGQVVSPREAPNAATSYFVDTLQRERVDVLMYAPLPVDDPWVLRFHYHPDAGLSV